MSALAFFLLGIPAAFAVERLIFRFSRPVGDLEDESLATKRLPWQAEPWPARVRLALAMLTPPLMAIAGWRFEAVAALAVTPLILAMLICTGTDLLRYRVPNAVTYPGTLLALLAAVLMPDADLVSALLAALLGGGLFLLLAVVSRGGIGLGDVKLAVLIGAALGLPGAYQALFIGMAVAGAVLVLLLVGGIVGRRQAVPYAPFLALSAVGFVLLNGAAFAPL
ncbi:MAG: hypothetical protein GEU75_08725 [Dehalococcoidia bacterium]|nr:hypothetical protein [Dehalococcoidia bacterium]